MPTSTLWRRRASVYTRGPSPVRPSGDDIERMSPEPSFAPTTRDDPARNNSSYHIDALLGLGLSHGGFLDSGSMSDQPEEMYLDQHGGAHVRGRREQHSSPTRNGTSRQAGYNSNPKASKSRGHTRSGSTIDDLASAAIATSPAFANGSPHQTYIFSGSPSNHMLTRPNTSHISGYAYTNGVFEPPAKRVKSEKLPAVPWTPQPARPTTSYTSFSFDAHTTHEDAALLLGLRNEVNFKKESPALAIAQIHHSPQQDQRAVSPITPAQQTKDEETRTSTSDRDITTSEDPIQHLNNPDPQPLLTNGIPHELATAPVEEANDLNMPPQTRSSSAQGDKPIQLPAAAPPKKPRRVKNLVQEVCAECNKIQRETEEKGATETWISCNGCSKWFHAACAGISTKSEARSVDKFICKSCEPIHGITTFVRKSSRAKTALDYAAVNQGLTQSSDEVPYHHYIQPIKTGKFVIQPDDFARVRPELLTVEFMENFDNMKRPWVVPAAWNPRFGAARPDEDLPQYDSENTTTRYIADGSRTKTDEAVSESLETEEAIDCDQDLLDMVMPRDLTVRKVAHLYGPQETVPVINVKTQDGSINKTLEEWADYYEKPVDEDKPIYNVISLEVSNSKLGRLIRRPKVVRDLDLEEQVQDSVSRTIQQKRPVQFYCLMSVADSYTDFHIDFGGSSVYYHILKGTKTFFFIPPEDKYLKEYEKWCNSSTQNETWLPDMCGGNVTRVDLHEGDTAFIPAGWIHSVWTPEDSLVIGGNFLSRLDYELQFKVAQVEKATHVAPKFKYPYFQKVMWYALLKYLEDDPVPEAVMEDFQADQDYTYLRADPMWNEFGDRANVSEPGSETYNARYYPRSEMKGLPSLRDFLYRTARIYSDLPVSDITKRQIDAVKGSVPKGHGDPLQLIKTFAIWCAWKIGSVPVPDWVHSDVGGFPDSEKKTKKPETYRLPGERVSQRKAAQSSPHEATGEAVVTEYKPGQNAAGVNPDPSKKTRPPSLKPSTVRTACEACRKRRIRCRHKENGGEVSGSLSPVVTPFVAEPDEDPSLLDPSLEAFPALGPSAGESDPDSSLAQAALASLYDQSTDSTIIMNGLTPTSSKKSRSKACEECRKSKRRCVHDEYGRVDAQKAAEPAKPRGSSNAKRPSRPSDENLQPKRPKTEGLADTIEMSDAMIDPALLLPPTQEALNDPMQIDLPNGADTEYASAYNGTTASLADGEGGDVAMQDYPPAEAAELKQDSDQPPSPVSKHPRQSVEFAGSGIVPEHAIDDTPEARPLVNGDASRYSTSPSSQRLSSRQSKPIERYVPDDHRSPNKIPLFSSEADRRGSSAVSVHSLMHSVKSRRSSSNTSGTIHVMATQIEKAPNANGGGRAGSRESTAESELDADERMARELQAEEHGLRRKRSMRL